MTSIETTAIAEKRHRIHKQHFPARLHSEQLHPGLLATNVAEKYPSLTPRSGKLALEAILPSHT
jgi:hypothetical protein